MKKRIGMLLVVGMMLLCSSCTLNMGDTHVDLPWPIMTAFMLAPTLLITFIVVWCTTSDNRKNIYVCPHCHHRFKPGVRVIWSPHVMDEYSLKCPRCGKRDWCSMSYDQND